MLTKNTLRQFQEFRELKKNRHNLSKEQYIKELQFRLENVKADIAAPELSESQIQLLFQLLDKRKAT